MESFCPRLEAYLRHVSHARSVSISSAERLTAGAIQENWLIAVSFDGGPMGGKHELVLRRDAITSIGNSRSRAEEFALITLAHQSGIKVPKPLYLCTDIDVLGRSFFLMQKIVGSADGRVITREDRTRSDRRNLLTQMGRELALIHRVRPSLSVLSFLGKKTHQPAKSAILRYRNALDALPQAAPILEWGLRWGERHLPKPANPTLCHRDFRIGNLMIKDNHLTGVLDWEFADWGDPMEDVGWFCAKCWRFGLSDRDAGGLGKREDFYAGYSAAGGTPIDTDSVWFWEVMAHIRWAIIAREQGERFATQGERSLEPALTAYIAPQLEWEMMQMTEQTRP